VSNWIDRCHFGDCRDTMRAMIADGVKVQTIVTSPPYWGLRDYGVAGQIGMEPTLREFIATLTDVFELCRELLADDGTAWVNMGDAYAGSWGSQGREYSGVAVSALSARQVAASQRKLSGTGTVRDEGLKPKDLMGQPWRLAFALQDAGWYLRSDIIWHKPNPMPESITDRPTKSHEYLFLLTKSARYFYDADAIKEIAIAGIEPRGVGFGHGTDAEERARGRVQKRDSFKREIGKGSVRHPGAPYGNHRPDRKDTEITGYRNRRSVWTIATQSFSGAHFATFPEALVEPCVLAGSRVGDIVFDPFFGSGTTGQVAQRLGRRFIGCELNRDYEPLQRDRLRQPGLELTA
jgi:site-specific DNA-methyltransferase (cytosine-N4-specific)